MKSDHGGAWTDEIVSRMEELLALGYTARQIKNRLNREFGTTFTRNSIIGKVHRLELEFRK